MLAETILHNTRDLIGKELHATDGFFGHVKDFYFDDEAWTVRYLVVNTGSWLTGHLVLLSPHAFEGIGHESEIIRVNLSKQQIQDSPLIDTHRPISREYEEEYYHYYGWPTYWGEFGTMGTGGVSMIPPPPESPTLYPETEPHLQSLSSVTGYQIEAMDGALGYLSGLMLAGKELKIHEVIIETGLWHFGKEIHICPDEIKLICSEDSTITVRLTKALLLGKGSNSN